MILFHNAGITIFVMAEKRSTYITFQTSGDINVGHFPSCRKYRTNNTKRTKVAKDWSKIYPKW